MMIEAEIERDAVIEGDNALLIVDDDRPFSTRLAPRHGEPWLSGDRRRERGRGHRAG